MENTTVYSKTARGLAELKTPTRNLSRDQTRALVMVDGQTSIEEFTRAMPPGGGGRFTAILRELEQIGLVRATTAAPRSDDGRHAPGALPVIAVEELSGEESVQAWAEARRGVQALQETGFFAHHDKATGTEPGRTGANANANAGGMGGAGRAARKVLVVEDDEDILHMLEMLLAEAGFAVHAASTVAAAVAQLDDPMPLDLVLLDVVLPGGPGQDGFHILEAIRNHGRWRHLPVIMVTSQISDAHVLRGLKAGADGYIFKPFKWDTLYRCIRSVTGA